MNELVCIEDFSKYASTVLPRNALSYFKSGAGKETTLLNNKAAFSR